MEGLGERIRVLRGTISQGEFAKKLGFSLRQIGSWERDQGDADPEFFNAIARHYGDDAVLFLIRGKTGSGTKTAHEDGVPYVTREDQELAAALAKHPILKGAVKKVIELDDKFIQRAQALADAMAIPLEAACLVLLMKERKT